MLLLICGVVVAMSTAAVGYSRPPLRLTKSGKKVHVDVQKLGEYPTHVARVRLVDDVNDALVWEVRTHGAAQLSIFDLLAGENPRTISHMAWGEVVVVAPQQSTFTIGPSHRYVIEVWGTNLSITRTRARFSI
jgi:hypothetical protein